MTFFRSRLRAAIVLRTLLASAAACMGFVEWSDGNAGTPTYSIDFFTISAGGNTLSNPCYRLNGTLGQVVPGYSSGMLYSLNAGYWQPAPFTVSDEIFFSGFEGC